MSALATKSSDTLNVYLIGNNPIELSSIYEKLRSIKTMTYKMEMDFDLASIFKKITQFNPACILIDDNLEKLRLTKLVKKLSSDDKTKDIPITIIKNSNYHDAHVDEAQEFILKDTITPETLQRSILNSMRFKRMQVYIYRTYRKRKTQINRLLNS
ncbi:MAG: hypothetical protein MJA30_23780 [Cytophagales bacterium]|nr:hypothetical protein [Cytophagales bacterium]